MKYDLGRHTDLRVHKRVFIWDHLVFFPCTATERVETAYYKVQHLICFCCNMKTAFFLIPFCNLTCEASLMFSGSLPDYWWPTFGKDFWSWLSGILAQIHSDGNLDVLRSSHTLGSIYQRVARQISNLLLYWFELLAIVLHTPFTPNIRISCP